MSFGKALVYFVSEALENLRRSWKISLLAVLTAAVSLFVVGAFLLAGDRLGGLIREWRASARVVVYLDPEIGPEARSALEQRLLATPWVARVDTVSASAATERFRATFPELAGLLGDLDRAPFPPSFEVVLASEPERTAFSAWAAELEADPEVEMVDDDRGWLAQLSAVAAAVRAVGGALGLVLLVAATFTVASVVRLTVHLYREEIAVMRLVGATEFFIRGPFYCEGLLQGLLGGTLALGSLALANAELARRGGAGLLGVALRGGFLSPAQAAGLLTLGAVAGLLGAVVSLRGEAIRAEVTEESP